MVVEPAPGAEVDAGGRTESQARHWGQALARLHRDAAGLDAGLPESFGELPDIGELFAGDAELTEATARLTDAMGELPRCDFDAAALSWYAADVAYAVRDLTDHTGRPAAGHRARFDAFLDGYRGVRPSTTRTWGACRCSPACMPRLLSCASPGQLVIGIGQEVG
ncbi:hypothetical protein ABT373_26730 [Streptomyces sp. NPDC000070]|uniref:hypothetical protein n=1 Tax=Streptomyces sp. NPDC000070 TaxID=3154240 RepID=UPI0033189925